MVYDTSMLTCNMAIWINVTVTFLDVGMVVGSNSCRNELIMNLMRPLFIYRSWAPPFSMIRNQPGNESRFSPLIMYTVSLDNDEGVDSAVLHSF